MIFSANQMTGIYMKRNTVLKWVNQTSFGLGFYSSFKCDFFGQKLRFVSRFILLQVVIIMCVSPYLNDVNFDIDLDLVSMLCSQLTYEGLVAEAFKIRSSKLHLRFLLDICLTWKLEGD